MKNQSNNVLPEQYMAVLLPGHIFDNSKVKTLQRNKVEKKGRQRAVCLR
jgi:hypothetical protein